MKINKYLQKNSEKVLDWREYFEGMLSRILANLEKFKAGGGRA